MSNMRLSDYVSMWNGGKEGKTIDILKEMLIVLHVRDV